MNELITKEEFDNKIIIVIEDYTTQTKSKVTLEGYDLCLGSPITYNKNRIDNLLKALDSILKETE